MIGLAGILDQLASPERVAAVVGIIILGLAGAVGFAGRGWMRHVDEDLREKATVSELARVTLEVNKLREVVHDLRSKVTPIPGLEEAVERLERELEELQREVWSRRGPK